ncbi:hypothetical protein [Bradyrhizobium cenepequi]
MVPRRELSEEGGVDKRIGQARRAQPMGIPMVKLFHHSLFSIAFIVIRIFAIDAAVSAAHGKNVIQAQYVVSDEFGNSAKTPKWF